MKIVKLITVLLILNSCSPQKRLNNLIKHHPELISSDTIFKKDTTIIRTVSTDSSFYYNQTDTVIVREGKLLMKYFYRNDTVFLKGECIGDTIIKNVPVVVNTVTAVNDPINKFQFGVEIFIVLLLIVMFYKMFIQKK